jgi:hypothetical protein
MFGWLKASINSTSLRTACSSKHIAAAGTGFGGCGMDGGLW